MGMGKLVIALFGLCVLPALASAVFVAKFELIGRVYCDTCRFHYETRESSPGIAGATVKIECKGRDDMNVKYVAEGVTNSTGFYSISIEGDRGDDICDVKLVSSPRSDCFEPDPFRSSSRVILTRSNGLCDKSRFANALAFLRFESMFGCTKILKGYEDKDE